jgi:hypothetical protein
MQRVLIGEPDRAVQLMGDRADGGGGWPGHRLGGGDGESGVGAGVHGQGGRGRGRLQQQDLAGQGGKMLLNGLERAQRAAELPAFAGVGGAELSRGSPARLAPGCSTHACGSSDATTGRPDVSPSMTTVRT